MPRTKKIDAGTDAPPTGFEASLAELEQTIARLEEADLTLDDSLALFEKGVTLIRMCDTHLKKAQGKVSELLKGENGEFVEKTLGLSLDAFIAKDAPND